MTQTIIIIESGTDFTRFIQAEYIFQNRIILGENGFQGIEGTAFRIDVNMLVNMSDSQLCPFNFYLSN